MELYLGIGRSVITPKVGAALYGYAPDHFSTSINDDLTATVFYFEQDGERALLASLTLGSLSNGLADEIMSEIEKRHGIPRARRSFTRYTRTRHPTPRARMAGVT